MAGTLTRRLGLTGLMAAGISSMVGASIYIVPFMVQRNVPGIGPWVLPAFMVAAVPALLAALAYAALSSAMPRAGGSYIFVSRIVHPYWGFIASFSQWFGLSVVIGVVAYLSPPFFAELARLGGYEALAASLSGGASRLWLSLGLLWVFVGMNLFGLRTLQTGMVALVLLTFLLAGIVLAAGLWYSRSDYLEALKSSGISYAMAEGSAVFSWGSFCQASALLFASYIGFDAIAQAGGEARNPARNLPIATLATIGGVAVFYWLFTAAVYGLVPWTYMYREAQAHDISAPSLLAPLLPSGCTALLSLGAAVALVKDLPAMILATSRLSFAWARDGLFPSYLLRVHPRYGSPYIAVLLIGVLSTLGVLGSHWAGDIFLGIDIMVVSMLCNFLLVSVALLRVRGSRPAFTASMTVLCKPWQQLLIGGLASLSLSAFMAFTVWKDLTVTGLPWYFHPTWAWLIVMIAASLLFYGQWRRLQRRPPADRTDFTRLPDE